MASSEGYADFSNATDFLDNSQILRGDQTTLSGILDPVNFETNVKSIRRDYETHVLSIGEYDERVFLGGFS